MKKQRLSAVLAAMSVAVFGILYPEYILLPETYEYIAETVPYEKNMFYGQEEVRELTDLLHAKPKQIRVSSKLLQMLEEEGITIWKNRN